MASLRKSVITFKENVKSLLIEEDNSGLILKSDHKLRLKISYKAAPINSSVFKSAVLKELNKQLFVYNQKLDGIVLHFRKVRVFVPIEATLSRSINVICSTDVYIFNPKPGSILTGIVNKKSCNHIGCILYSIFNISVIKPKDMKNEEWKGNSVKLLDKVQLHVIRADLCETIPYIIGEILNSETHQRNNSETEPKVSDECTDMKNEIIKSGKKRKKNKIDIVGEIEKKRIKKKRSTL